MLHDGSASTFHFVNRLGQAAQIKDRDDVKELLQQLLQKFKREVNKELEEKNRYYLINFHIACVLCFKFLIRCAKEFLLHDWFH